MKNSKFTNRMKRWGVVLATLLCFACVAVGGTACKSGGGLGDLLGGAFPWGKYTVTLNVNDTAMGNVAGDKATAEAGETVSISATANYGYDFLGWYEGETQLSAEAEYTFTMPERDVVYEAKFTAHIYTLSVSSKYQGFTDVNSGDYPYLTEVTLTANKIDGAVFTGWYDENGILVTKSLSFKHVIDKDLSLEATYFTLVQYELISLPEAEPSTLGESLRNVTLTGGETTVPGVFVWTDESKVVTLDDYYFVTFLPDVDAYSPCQYVIDIPLKTAVLNTPSVSMNNNKISWDTVEGATGYTVTVNEEEIHLDAFTTTYELPGTMNEYYISVRSEGDNVAFSSSESSEIIRYVPPMTNDDADSYGTATSVYEDGVLKKFGGTIPLNNDNVKSFATDVEVNKDYIYVQVQVDVSQHIAASTKREVLRVNDMAQTMGKDVSITMFYDLWLWHPQTYIEVDMAFPIIMQDLEFGISFESVTTTVANININGEFVDSERRRETLHLLFIDIIGLEKPLYKWSILDFDVPGTYGMLDVELSVCFDAVGAIAASLYLESMETSNYAFGLQLISNGVPVFNPYYEKEIEKITQTAAIAGELDLDLNFIRLAASLRLAMDDNNPVSIVRLNADLFSLKTDLSGETSLEYGMENGVENFNHSGSADLAGYYRFYGQVTFEYYLEIKLNFGFLPLDGFGIRLLDGSLIMAEWEYAKGGIPKTPYKDEALYTSTAIYATDGTYQYYKDNDGTLLKSEGAYDDGLRAAIVDTSEIVDIDNYYLYVFTGNALRRVGRQAGTERTVLSGVSHILGSDRNYIYYTTAAEPNKIMRYYRSDFESQEPVFVSLPKGWEGVRMRYDYNLSAYVIYAVHTSGADAYFTFDGKHLMKHGANEHAYWETLVYDNGAVAYYSMNKDNVIKECFIRYPDSGITHEDKFTSLGLSPLGLVIVKEKAKGSEDVGVLPYEIGIYAPVNNRASFVSLGEVANLNAARTVSYYDGYIYVTDVGESNVRVLKSDGKTAKVICGQPYDIFDVSRTEVRAEMHGSWLFAYTYKKGNADVFFIIDVDTLAYVPYLVDGAEREYDRATPETLTFTINGQCSVSALFLNRYSESDVKATKKLGEIADKVSKYFKEVGKVWSEVKDTTSKTIEFFNTYSDTYLSILDACIVSGENTLELTIPTDVLQDFDYGLYTGYIVTTKGMFTVYIEVTDSRQVTIVTEETLEYDKGNPSIVKFEVKTYDETLTGSNVKKGKYIQIEKDIETDIFRFDASYLSTLPYGVNELKFYDSEGNEIVLKIKIKDSRSPADSVYSKTYDKTFSKDLTFTFDLYDEKYVTSVEGGGIPSIGAYTVDYTKGSLTFKENYLMGLVPDYYIYTLTTSEKTFQVTVYVIESVLPTLSVDKTFDLASSEDFVVSFARNDAAEYFNLYVNNALLTNGVEYFYDKTAGKIYINNEYLQHVVPYGEMQIRLGWTIRSGDEDHGGQLTATCKITDTRTPTVEQDLAYSVTTDSDTLQIAVRTYNKEVLWITVNGEQIPAQVRMYTLSGAKDYRGGYIVVNAATLANTFGGGTHDVSVLIGDCEYSTTLMLLDERMPKMESDLYYYDKETPSTPTYYIRLYDETLRSVSGNGITADDYTWSVFENNALYHVLTLNDEYIERLALAHGQELTFTLETNVNSLTVYLHVLEERSENGGEDSKPGGGSSSGSGITVADIPKVTPSSQSLDKSAIQDLLYEVDYGNNAFGSLSYGFRTLTKGTHFELVDGNILLKGDWLSSLSYGTHSFTLRCQRGFFSFANFEVRVYDSADPYMTGETELRYDKYEGGNRNFTAQMFDSKCSSVEINGVTYTNGFANTQTQFTLKESLLNTLAIGTYTVNIRFNDSEAVFTVSLIIEDTTLYYDAEVWLDKAVNQSENSTLGISWTLYQGNVEGIVDAPFTVASYNNEGAVLKNLTSAEYGRYTYTILANGHTFRQTIVVYDTRKPLAEPAEYTFDKGAYEYTLDPLVARTYDLHVYITLYDEDFDGLDLFGNQTLNGNGLEYEDYDRLDSGYTISYLYLYRMRVGTYMYTVNTTDGVVSFTVTVTDSRAPEMLDSDPYVYDYSTAENARVRMNLKGETVSSVSYTHYLTGALTVMTDEQYSFVKDEDGKDVLVINRAFLEKDFYVDYDYGFVVATTTERVLSFTLQIENGPKRPYRITYYSVPWNNGEPSFSLAPLVCEEGDILEKPTVPEEEYYNFLGFYTERSGGKQFDFTKPITSDQDIFLRWEPKTYTITLYSDGAAYKTVNVRYLDTIPTLEKPTKTGYTFIKWATDETYKTRFTMDGKQMPHENLCAYAEWELNHYTVKFVNASGVVLKEETVAAFENATPPTDREMWVEHYIFKGWSGSYTNVLSHLTLKGVYEAERFAILYELNGGTNVSSNPATYTVADYVKFADPTRTGYNFLGWYETEDFSGMPVRSIPFGSFGGRRLYARWRAIEYDIVYDKNQPTDTTELITGNMHSTHHAYEEQFNLPENKYALTNYLFVGWALTQTGDPIYLDGASVQNLMKTDGELTLYARWVKVTEFNGHYYAAFSISSITSWSAAKAYCESYGGYLATVTSAEEDAFLFSMLYSRGYNDAYIGYTDENHEGIWEWVTGEVSSYVNWGSGEPNNASNAEHYAHYYYEFTNGQWNDIPNSKERRGFLCEWGEVEVPENDLRYGVNIAATQAILLGAEDCEETRLVLPTDVNGLPVTRIYANAFKGRTDIEYVIIPDTVTTIDSTAFSGWTKAQYVVIMQESIPSAWASALANVTVLTNADIGSLEGSEDIYIYKGWEVYRKATCLEAGEERSYCINAEGIYKTREIPAYSETDSLLGHDWTNEYYCRYCGTHLTELVAVAEFNGHYYAVFDLPYNQTFEETQAYCESLGGYLATITSAEEDAFVYSAIKKQGHTGAHFGLTDEGHEGYWTWVTGETASYMNWHSDQPDNWNGETTENYGHYWSDYPNGQWNDSNYERYASPFICEWGAYTVDECNVAIGMTTAGVCTVYGLKDVNATDVVIPNTYNGVPVTTIKEKAFQNCSNIRSLTIGENIVTIGARAFDGCTGLTEIYYNAKRANDIAVDNYIFAYAGNDGTGITLTIGNKVEYIPQYMFCPNDSYFDTSANITSLLFEEDSVCTEIRYAAFERNHRLHTVILPDSLTSIGKWGFSNCREMTKIVIPTSLKTVAHRAFLNVAPVVYYKGTAEDWTQIGFDTDNHTLQNAVRSYYSEEEPDLNESGEMYNGNYWHFVDGEPTLWTTGEMIFLIEDEERIVDTGYWGLAQDNADIIDLSPMSKYNKEGYTFLFEVIINMHEEDEKDDGYQQVFLYTSNKLSDSSSESTANSIGKLTAADIHHRGENPAEHKIIWAVDGEDCRSVLYLRYDAGNSEGDTDDDWVRHNVTIKVTVISDNE